MEKMIANKLPEFRISVSMKAKSSELYRIKSAADAADVFRMIFDADQIEWREEAAIICLSKASKVIGYHKISSGGITGTVVDIRIIAQVALLSNATSIILCHNHPSGNLVPSQQDKTITTKLRQGLQMLEIEFIDHIILTAESHFSMAEDGLL